MLVCSDSCNFIMNIDIYYMTFVAADRHVLSSGVLVMFLSGEHDSRISLLTWLLVDTRGRGSCDSHVL